MGNFDRNTYTRERNKEAYKTVKVYIPINEYDAILAHSKQQGHKAMSGYIKSLIDADMKKNIPAEK